MDLSASATTDLGTQSRRTVAYTITVTNASTSDVQAEVLDQLPVSKDQDITIRLAKTDPRGAVDVNGTLRWKLPLKAGETRTLTYRFEALAPTGKMPARIDMLLPKTRE